MLKYKLKYISHRRSLSPTDHTGYALPVRDKEHAIVLAAKVVVAVDNNTEFDREVTNFMLLEGDQNYLGFCVAYDRLPVVQKAVGIPGIVFVRSLVTPKKINKASRLFA